MGLEAVLPCPQNALYVMYVMLCWASAQQPAVTCRIVVHTRCRTRSAVELQSNHLLLNIAPSLFSINSSMFTDLFTVAKCFRKYVVCVCFPVHASTSLRKLWYIIRLDGVQWMEKNWQMYWKEDKNVYIRHRCVAHVLSRPEVLATKIFGDTTKWQASSGRECPLCRQRHIWNMF